MGPDGEAALALATERLLPRAYQLSIFEAAKSRNVRNHSATSDLTAMSAV